MINWFYNIKVVFKKHLSYFLFFKEKNLTRKHRKVEQNKRKRVECHVKKKKPKLEKEHTDKKRKISTHTLSARKSKIS